MRSLSVLLALLCFLATPAQAGSKKAKTKAAQTTAVDPKPETDPSPPPLQADPAAATAKTLNAEWAEIFYRLPSEAQTDKYSELLSRIRAFKAQYPRRAEPLILEAITLCTLAAADWGFDSLSRIGEARELLEKSIDLDPKAMEASAFLTLGNLYYRLPGWPLSFGDEDQALQYYEMAVRLYPDGLDANYFMGDYWLGEEEYDKALPYLEKADKAPLRPAHRLSDSKLKGEVEKALKAARNRDNDHNDFFSQITPDFSE